MIRPVTITLIGWLFIVTGMTGFVYHLSELNLAFSLGNDVIWTVMIIEVLAVAGGILTLRRYNIGRWLITAWLVYHVVLSYFHSVSELVMHTVIAVTIAYFLFRADARVFFKKS